MEVNSDRRTRTGRTGAFTFLLVDLLTAGFLLLAQASQAGAETTFVVDSTGDSGEISPGDGICDVDDSAPGSQCTLRAAIQEANATTGANEIHFGIPGEDVKTIQLAGPLPILSDTTGPTTINGYTQLGSSPNTDLLASNAKIVVQIEGAGHESFDGLQIASPSNAVRGLAFYKLGKSIQLHGTGAYDNRIAGNFIGTDAAGAYFAPSRIPFDASGIVISGGASNNIIGGTSPAERNVISGNATHGVGFYGEGTDSNLVRGNVVGLEPSGNGPLPNRAHGVDMNDGASYNVIGGTGPGERNVISGNSNEGVEVSHYTTTVGNQVIGNFIGTDVTGRQAPYFAHNGANGVFLEDGVSNNVVRNNVIGNSNIAGIKVSQNTKGNRVYGNRIGIALGGAAIPNRVAGVQIWNGAQGSRIGPDNVIANNPVGVQIGGSDTTSNTIIRNSIFGNTGLGIDVEPYTLANENDPGDGDTGPNQQQNSAVIATATTSGDYTIIKGSLDSTPSQTFVLQFFSNPKGVNGGREFIGGKSVVTAADGKVSFVFRPAQAVRPGLTITSTVTDSSGNTSEFSNAVMVNTAPTIINVIPAPGSEISDRTPRIRATVRDAQTDLDKSHIKLYLDGEAVTTFEYDHSTDRLSYTSDELSYGGHTVKIVATDPQGLKARKEWSFRVVR